MLGLSTHFGLHLRKNTSIGQFNPPQPVEKREFPFKKILSRTKKILFLVAVTVDKMSGSKLAIV